MTIEFSLRSAVGRRGTTGAVPTSTVPVAGPTPQEPVHDNEEVERQIKEIVQKVRIHEYQWLMLRWLQALLVDVAAKEKERKAKSGIEA